jgi:hypothetical protein
MFSLLFVSPKSFRENWIPILLGVFWILGCSSTISNRIKDNQSNFDSYSTKTQQKIRIGVIEEGMSEEMVYLAKGKPSRIERLDPDHSGETLWYYYKTDYSSVPGQPQGSLSSPYGYPAVGEPFRPSGVMVQKLTGLIRFQNHRVVVWKEFFGSEE